jgi:hypothetical protein
MNHCILFVFASSFLTGLSQKDTVLRFKFKKSFEDTIDVSILPHSYTLKNIKQFNGGYLSNTGECLNFWRWNPGIKWSGNDGLAPLSGDTMLTMNWDRDDSDGRTADWHVFGIAHLNRKSNTIIVYKARWNSGKKSKTPVKRMYKILKWTFYGITLKDISLPQYNRTFYFIKN